MIRGSIQPEEVDELLSALSEQLRAHGIAFRIEDSLTPADLFPEPLLAAARQVARDFGLAEGWFNPGPADLAWFGLPEGFESRMVTRSYGPNLTVHFADRFDQIHFKLYAMVDQGIGRHEDDLRVLDPSPEELLAAARWTRTQDPSDGSRQELLHVLEYLGVPDANVD